MIKLPVHGARPVPRARLHRAALGNRAEIDPARVPGLKGAPRDDARILHLQAAHIAPTARSNQRKNNKLSPVH